MRRRAGPTRSLSETIENGVRAYYSHDDGEGFYRQRPIMLTLLRRDDGRTGVEIRVAPFALPQTLEADSEMAGLPRPKPTKTAKSSGGSDSVRREMEVAVIAELPATLAFYRRELASRNWTEETNGAVVTPDNVTLKFSSAEQIGDADARPQIRSDRRQPRHADEGSGAGRARQGEEGSRREVHEGRRSDGQAGDRRRRGAAGRAGRQSVGCAACARWPTARRRCRCRRTRKT